MAFAKLAIPVVLLHPVVCLPFGKKSEILCVSCMGPDSHTSSDMTYEFTSNNKFITINCGCDSNLSS